MESITQNKTIAVHLIEKKEEFQQLNVAWANTWNINVGWKSEIFLN